MKKQKMPKKITGLHQREGSANWWLRTLSPKELQAPFYGNKAKLRQSLNTADRTEAELRAVAAQAEHLERFKQQRAQLKPLPQLVVTDELAGLLAERIRTRIMGVDDLMRSDPRALEAFLQVFAPPRYFQSPRESREVNGPLMTPEQLNELSATHAYMTMTLAHHLTIGQLAYGEALAAGEARQLGLTADWSMNRPAVLRVLRAALEAWQAVGARNIGIHAQTPAMPEAPLAVQQMVQQAQDAATPTQTGSRQRERTLWDVLDEWAKGKPANSRAKAERALKLAEEAGASLVLSKLTWDDAVKVKEHIQKTKADASSKTRHDLMVTLQALPNFAVKSLHWIRSNAWAGVSIPKGSKRAKRLLWTDDDLRALFKAPLFQKYALDPRPAMCGAALYWVPLFQLLMGARPGELVQAQVGDVVTEEGTPLLSITDEGEEHDEDEEIPLHAKRVKTEAARRKVPIHPELLRLGFLDYLRDRRTDVGLEGELFAGLHKTARKEARSYFSDAFRDLTRELAIYKPNRDNYALRHTAVTALKSVTPALDPDLVVAIIGHESGSVAGKHYFDPSPKVKQDALENIRFPAVAELPRVYGKP